MAETLATVRTKVRYHIDEPTANYWADAELNALIDNRQRDLWRKIIALRKDYWLTSFTLNLVVNQFSYTTTDGVPADIWRIASIRTTTSGYQNLIWIPGNPTSQEFLDGLQTDVTINNPYQIRYALRNLTTLWITPLPQTAIAARIDYYQKPTVMAADTDTFLLPDEFMSYLEYMASSHPLSQSPVGHSRG